MKKIILIILLAFIATVAIAQDQTVNGNLTVKGEASIGQETPNKWGEGSRLHLRGIHGSNDPVWLAKYTAKHEYTDLRINVGDAPSSEDRFIVGTTMWDTKEWHNIFIVRMDGVVNIPRQNSKLDVNGTIRAKEVKIEATGWADFVFSPDYKLPTLAELKIHIQENKHLPNIPTEAEVKENGVDLGDMQIKLLQKIEELTLYVIELKEENGRQQKEINELKNK